MAGGTIADDSRVRAAAPTLAHLAKRGARVIVMSHLGRPKDREPELSLKPIVPADDPMPALVRRFEMFAPGRVVHLG